jgi:multiple sugar transport system permease protein
MATTIPQVNVEQTRTSVPVSEQKPRRWYRPQTLILRILKWVVVIAFAIALAYPLLWLVATTFKPRGDVFDNRLIPKTWVFTNYIEVWNQLPLVHWLGNSLFIAIMAAGLVTISSSIVAFGFAYFRFPGRNILFGLVIASMLLPDAITLIPRFLIWKQLGFLGTNVPLWGSNLFGTAFYIFLQRQFFLGLPRELFEAARIDGASYWGLFRRIAMPLSIPSFIIVFIFEFQASWTNLQAGLIYLNLGSANDYTVPLGISYAMRLYSPLSGGNGDYQYVTTAALIVTLPMLILFAFGQRYFIQGIATEGRKG